MTLRRRPAWVAISRAVVRSWRRIVLHAAGDSRPIIVAAGAAVAILVAAWTYLVTGLFQHALAHRPDGGALHELQRAATTATHLSWYAAGAGVLLGFVLLSPTQTAMQTLVLTRPVSALSHLVGQNAPLLAASFTASAVLDGPAAIAYLHGVNRMSSLPVAAEAGVLLLGLLAVDVAMLALLHAGAVLSAALGIRNEGLRKLFGLLAASIVLIAVSAHDLVALFDPSVPALLAFPVSLGWAGALAVPAALLALATGAVAALSRVTMGPPTGVASPTLLRRPRATRAPRPVVIALTELRILLRHPVLLTSSLLAFTLAVGASGLIAGMPAMARATLISILPLVAVSLAGLTAEGAYGRTAAWHHVYRHQPAPPKAWFVPKVAANLVYATALAAVLLLVLGVAGAAVLPALGNHAIWFGVLFPAAMLAGALLPYRDDVPFNAVLTSSLSIGGSIAIMLALGKVQQIASVPVQVGCGAAVAAGALSLARLAGD